jgi:hypothetical protein
MAASSQLDRVTAELEDAHKSLATALARIEVYRQREKLLRAEIAQLRCAASGGGGNAQNGAGGDQQQQQQHAHSQQHQERREPPAPASARPAYVTEIDEHVPVLLVPSAAGGRKVRFAKEKRSPPRVR